MTKGCNSCEVLYINGVKCHEIGCPSSWQDAVRECKFCDAPFKPESKNQTCCSDDCEDSFN